MTTIGVLALQGNFQKHLDTLQKLGVKGTKVTSAGDLEKVDGLILPGGESTTISRLLSTFELVEPLKEFAASSPIFGTCAGLILMAQHVNSQEVNPFGFLPIEVKRNAYGRQIDSFSTPLFSSYFDKLTGIFIRAPKIMRIADSVQVLATHNNDPVLVKSSHFLGAAFHPELTSEGVLHSFFIDLVRGKDELSPTFPLDSTGKENGREAGFSSPAKILS